MTILLVGSKGNMGRRYAAIMKHLNIDFHGVDIGDDFPKRYDEYSGVIYATPTEIHLDNIRFHNEYSAAPMLIEKPIAKKEFILPEDLKIMMVNQYVFLTDTESSGNSHYNYFKTGGDGIEWDCINVIGLATGRIELANSSPVWSCAINGQTLNIKDMDAAYISMIRSFLFAFDDHPYSASFNVDQFWDNQQDYIYLAHRKVRELIAKGSYEN